MRKGYLSFYQLGVLNAACECVKIAEKVTGKKGANAENFFYNSFFQAGIDNFVFPTDEEKYLPDSPVARKRLGIEKKFKYKDIYNKVQNTFDKMLPQGYMQNREFDGIVAIQCFIADLLVCMNCGLSYITILKRPYVSNELKEKIPTDFLLAYSNLLDCFKDQEASLVAPATIIDYDHIKRFDDILESGGFSRYQCAHIELESDESDKKKVISDIYHKGKALVEENIDLLRLKKATISLMSITPKIVDAIFGKFPGVISTLFGESAAKFLENKRSLSVYTGEDVFHYVILNEVGRMIREKEMESTEQVSGANSENGAAKGRP